MQTCTICNKICDDTIFIRQDAEMDLGDGLSGSLNVYYFCSHLHMYLWDIEFHVPFYKKTPQIINHLIKEHGCDVPILERALNKYLKHEI